MRTFENGTARAAIFTGPNEPLQLVTAPIPTPAPNEILVAIECCAICSSDLHTHGGRRQEPTPTVLGHEIVGRIMASGHSAADTDACGQKLNIGDRITWTVAACCGQCKPCRDGFTQKCLMLVKYGHERINLDMPFRGGLADVILLSPGTGIVKLPDDPAASTPVEILALANCSTATVAACLRTGFARRNTPGMAVAVLGVGVLGLTACAMARELYGASVVIACDQNPHQTRQATRFGATHTCTTLAELETLIAATTDRTGVDIAIELAGNIHTTRAALSACRIGGTAVLAGTTLPTDPLIIEPQTIVRKLLRIEGVHNYQAPDLVTAVRFLLGAGPKYPFASLIAATHSLGEIEAALTLGHNHPGQRVAIFPERG